MTMFFFTRNFKTNDDLPGRIKNILPEGAQDIYREAFNQAMEKDGYPSEAEKAAWNAVQEKYHLVMERWMAKE